MIYDGRKPARQHQTDLDLEVRSLMFDYDVIGLNLPPGWGKSYLARGWQRMFGKTDIITASNVLLRQYKRDYPELNLVMGKDNYDSLYEYELAKRIARTASPSVFNPLSAVFTSPRESRSVKCVIIDEAHTLGEMLRSAAATSFNTSKSGIPKGTTSEYQLSRWAKQRFHDLGHKVAQGAPSAALIREYEKVGAVFHSVVGHEQDSVFKLTRTRRAFKGRSQETLDVDVVGYPMGLIKRVLNADKVILMSGTLTKDETALLAAGRKWTWLSKPYLAPPENRPVYVQTMAREDRKNIPKVCEEIRRIYMENDKKPTLVHVTYGEMNEYAQHLSNLNPITNHSHNKEAAESKFRAKGGIWLAGGSAEGIDLRDDFCRVVIVPTLQFPNKGDMYIQKRLGRPDGNRWYCLKTLENTIQRLGRGLRHSEDYCNHYILDPYFPQLWSEYSDQFEKLNIVWGT